MPQHPVSGFRIDPIVVKEFKEMTKEQGYKTNQEVIELLMKKFINDPDILF